MRKFRNPGFHYFALFAIFCCTYFGLSTYASASGGASRQIPLPFVKGITADAQVKDWGDQGYKVHLMQPVHGQLKQGEDHSVSARVGWDSVGLWVLIDVVDNRYVESDDLTKLWRGDAVELFLTSAWNSKNKVQWVIATGGDSAQPRARAYFYDNRSDSLLRRDTIPLLYNAKCQGSRCRVEAMMNWKNLGVKPRVGTKVGFQVYVNDWDSPKTESKFRSAWYPSTGAPFRSDEMHQLELVETTNRADLGTLIRYFDLEKMEVRLTLVSDNSNQSKGLELREREKVLSKATMKSVEEGRSKGVLHVPAPRQPLKSLMFCMDGEGCQDLEIPRAENLQRFKSLVKEKDRWKKRYQVDRPWSEPTHLSALEKKYRGWVALMVRIVEGRERYSDTVAFDLLSTFLEIREHLKNKTDWMAAQRNEFWVAYWCKADGSGQPLVVSVPQNYDPNQKYPLKVILHGKGGRPQPAKWVNEGDALAIEPWGRGNLYYAGLGERDVLDAIDFMVRHYSVHTNRIDLMGGSMGGGGTWYLAMRHPGLFRHAKPNMGWTSGGALENLATVTVLNQHGAQDWSVPIDQSRYAVKSMLKQGFNILHKEHPKAGHYIPNSFKAETWLESQPKPLVPERIHHRCNSPVQGRNHYLQILEFDKVHQPAEVHARYQAKTVPPMLSIGLQNIRALHVDLRPLFQTGNDSLYLQLDTRFIKWNRGRGEEIYLVRRDEKWMIQKTWQKQEIKEEIKMRDYEPGGAKVLHRGEPLLIVYGTRGGKGKTEFLREMADSASLRGGPGYQMATGGYRIVRDIDLSGEEQKNANLLLLGGPSENKVVAKNIDHLPIRFENDTLIRAGDRLVSWNEGGIVLFHPNPNSPKRLMEIIAAHRSDKASREWYLRNIQDQPGINSYESPGDIADLSVTARDGAIRLARQFDRDWKWRQVPGEGIRLPVKFADGDDFMALEAGLNRRSTRSDFGMHWSWREEGRKYDPSWATAADLSIVQSDAALIVGKLRGSDLLLVDSLLVKEGRVIVYPEVNRSLIDRDKVYTLGMQSSVIWMLGGAEMNLLDMDLHHPRRNDEVLTILAPGWLD